MKIIVYQDLKNENKHGYQSYESTPDSVVVKEQVVPGAYGFPPMYIRHLQIIRGNETILVVSQTDYELGDAEKQLILAGALPYLISLEK